MTPGSHNVSSMRTYFILNCEYLGRTSLNCLYIPLSDRPVVVNKRRSGISAAPITEKKYIMRRGA